MTLKELLNVTDSVTRVQVCVRLFGSMFSTTRYKEALLKDEEASGLLQGEIKTVRVIIDDEKETMQVVLK